MTDPSTPSEEKSEHMRYLGCLGLLAECAVYVPEDLREQIERAMEDAHEAEPHIYWRRILNRIEVGVEL